MHYHDGFDKNLHIITAHEIHQVVFMYLAIFIYSSPLFIYLREQIEDLIENILNVRKDKRVEKTKDMSVKNMSISGSCFHMYYQLCHALVNY